MSLKMEVVSPLTFAHSNAGGNNKRRFACADAATSPALGAPASSSSPHHSADENMDDCSGGGGGGGYGYHATKRRRKNNQDVAAATAGSSSLMLQKENNWSISPFLSGTAAASSLSTPGCHSPNSGKFIGDIGLPSYLFQFLIYSLIHSPSSSSQQINEIALPPLNTVLDSIIINIILLPPMISKRFRS